MFNKTDKKNILQAQRHISGAVHSLNRVMRNEHRLPSREIESIEEFAEGFVELSGDLYRYTEENSKNDQ